MNAYTSDAAVIASAINAAKRGETIFTPLLCGLHATWRQRRLFECAFYAEIYDSESFRQAMTRFRAENDKES